MSELVLELNLKICAWLDNLGLCHRLIVWREGVRETVGRILATNRDCVNNRVNGADFLRGCVGEGK